MPARHDGMDRTPSGRASRKVIPVLPIGDLAAAHRLGHEAIEAQLRPILDDLTRMKVAAAIAITRHAALKVARAERNRLIAILWVFNAAGGLNLAKASGLSPTALNKVKLEQLAVKSIPLVAGTQRTDKSAVRELAAQRGLNADPDASDRLSVLAMRVAELEGSHQVACKIRDNLAIQAVIYTGMSQASVAELIGRLPNQVSRMVRGAGDVPKTIQSFQSVNSQLNLPASSLEKHYRELVALLEDRGAPRSPSNPPRKEHDRSLTARQAVLTRAEGKCENPQCTGMPPGLNRKNQPILDVDHIQDLASSGADHPENMIAVCPNCHASKTRGDTEYWSARFTEAASIAHQNALQYLKPLASSPSIKE